MEVLNRIGAQIVRIRIPLTNWAGLGRIASIPNCRGNETTAATVIIAAAAIINYHIIFVGIIISDKIGNWLILRGLAEIG